MKKPKAELLAPAGSLATLKAVAAAGADAVYGAGEWFGARAYADNFTREELTEAVDYLHLQGKRFYLTVNTLLKEGELTEKLYDYILPLYQQGLDGVIVQDLGVLSFLRRQFPGLELHASTQMSVTGPRGAGLLKELGVTRIVPARELSLGELERIYKETGLELETFVHGALCYCYSGQCLFSSMLGGRSGNRGRCAQPCRLPYRLGKETGPERYLLSPKDLCAIELLPRILKSGVYSLKIEGRMKQLEYAAGVTEIYRRYLDRCLQHPQKPYQVAEEDLRQLAELGSRSGFTRGYYEMHNGPEMMAMEKSAHTSGDEALQARIRARFAKEEPREKIKGILRLSKGFPSSLMVEWNGIRVFVEGAVPQEALRQPLSREAAAEKIQKTGNSGFVFEALEIELEDNLFLTVGELNRLRRQALEELRRKALSEFRRERPLPFSAEQEMENPGKGQAVWVDPDREQKFEDRNRPYLAAHVQNMEQLSAALDFGWVRRIYLEADALPREPAAVPADSSAQEPAAVPVSSVQAWGQAADLVHRTGKELYCVLPACLREASAVWFEKHLTSLWQAGIDGFVTGSYEGLGLLSAWKRRERSSCRILGDSSLYVWNGASRQTLAGLGADEITLPLEANARELEHRAFLGGELLLYGHLPLMVSVQCVVKNTVGCQKQSGFRRLSDRRGKSFPVRNQCADCYNVIYNTSPLWLFHQKKLVEKLKADGYRILFTTESPKQIRQVLSCYEQAFVRNEAVDPKSMPKDYTNGHLKRGVE